MLLVEGVDSPDRQTIAGLGREESCLTWFAKWILGGVSHTQQLIYIAHCYWEGTISGKAFIHCIHRSQECISCHRSSYLWSKLFKVGVSGPLFDWLWMLYAHMSYVMHDWTASTARFKSIIGVLTGDTASPVLWNIYFVDLGNWLQDDIYDVHLHTLFISHVEQADDIALFSTTFYSLQKKVDCFLEWCDVNFMDISTPKSKWMIMGHGGTGQLSLKVRA